MVIQFPKIIKTEEVPSATFKDFAFQIMLSKIQEATESLLILFKVDKEQASRFANHYYSKSKKDPMLMTKTMQIREALDHNNTNDGIELLIECFGMSAPEAIVAFSVLKSNY